MSVYVVMAAVKYVVGVATVPLRWCLPVTTRPIDYGKPIAIITGISMSFRSKQTRRKNYLRQKMLRTLRKLEIDFDSAPPQRMEEIEIQKTRECDGSGNSDSEVSKEVEISAPPWADVDGNYGKFDRATYIKFGVWLAGAFILQTVCAFWIFGFESSEGENKIVNRNRKTLGLQMDENGPGDPMKKFILNGNVNVLNGIINDLDDRVGYEVGVELEKKIEEIRAMAREARKKEKTDSKNNILDGEESDGIDSRKFSKSGVKEEVNNRLVKLRRKLENERDHVPVEQVKRLNEESGSKNGIRENGLSGREVSAALTFKKKYKFKHLENLQREGSPQGFPGVNDHSTNKYPGNINGGHVSSNLGGLEGQLDLAGVETQGSDAVHVAKIEDVVDFTRFSKSTRIAEEERLMNEKPGAANGDRWLTHEVDTTISAMTDTVSNRENDTLWWSNLPYVLGILMYRYVEGDIKQGFYTLKDMSGLDSNSSYIVAFEDSGDATNFCYILECFFEDLRDFKAEVVPVKAKELIEDVTSKQVKVFVVRRGQLQLYAGQPLNDVESQIRAMVE